MSNEVSGAWRLKPATTTYEPGVELEALERVFCPDATPRCETCSDFGEWVSEDGSNEPCPGCSGPTPNYRAKRDGRVDA